MNHCIECKHIARSKYHPPHCEHPKTSIEDPVYGYRTPPCYDARAIAGPCGPDAVYFEKETR